MIYQIDITLEESSVPVYKRKGNVITTYYKCTSGPKKGKLISDPAMCNIRPNPKRVRHGKIISRTKQAIRLQKTNISKKRSISKRLTQMNKLLHDRRVGVTKVKESFIQYMQNYVHVDINEVYTQDVNDYLDIVEQYILQSSPDKDFVIEYSNDDICLIQYTANEQIMISQLIL